MNANTVKMQELVAQVIEYFGEEPCEFWHETPFSKHLRTMAQELRAQMEAEEAALCRHLEERYDGWTFTADCALEAKIGAWA